MTDLLFHKVTKKEKEQISKQSKFLMDDFSKKLSKINKQKIPKDLIKSLEGERKEKFMEKKEDFSREIMFKNALFKNKDFIMAEKKKW